MKKILFLSIFFCSFLLQAQTGYWQEARINKEEVKESLANVNLDYIYELNLEVIKSKLLQAPKRSLETNNLSEGVVVSFPTLNGELENFRVVEASNFSEELAEKYPSIKSYRGSSLENPSRTISISLAENRMKAVFFTEENTSLIEPVAKNSTNYVVYNKDAISLKNEFECFTENTEKFPVETQETDDMILRTFQLAVTTDGEFGQYYGTTTAALAGVNDLLMIVNPIYERDLAVHLELVPNNDQLIFLDPNNDPFQYVSQNNNNLNSATQSTITNVIGEANYDIGIVFSSQADGGNAGCISCVCNDFSKGSAYAGASGFPEGYYFAMIIAHEMGHQFGANHTFSRAEGTNANREPGSGTTIMSYAGITFLYDIQSQPDDFFNHYSIDQISNYIQTTSCADEVPINNQTPTVDAGSDYAIPASTAFKLTATGSDPDAGDQLTYSWEQADSNNTSGSFLYPDPTSTQNPTFRVYNPTSSPIQYFPPFDEVLNGSLFSTWNMVSTVTRTLNFVVQARDNSSLGGQTASDAMQVQVNGNAGPFQITSIENFDGFPQAEQHDLTWDVNGTNGGNINTSNVKISLSTDGGNTFSTLIASTANDGQESITFPSQNVDEAFIMIEAIDNIYYAVSPSFAIGNDSTINCDEFVEQGPITIPANGTPAQINLNVQDTGSIEDINVSLDISGGQVGGLLAFLFGPNDAEPTFLYTASCNGNSLNVTFDQEGESIILNCGNQNSPHVEPLGGDLSKYYGTPKQGNWSIAVVNAGGPGGAVINSASIEFCSRDVVDLSTGKFAQNSDAQLYPNPTNGQVKMNYESTSGQDVVVEVFNITGKRVFTKTNNFTQKTTTNLDLSALASGVYLVKMNDGNQQVVKKLIVK